MTKILDITQLHHKLSKSVEMKFVNDLDSNSKIRLFDLMRSSKSYKVRKRAHAILLSAKKYKIDQLANIFDVDRDTVSEWLRRWEELGIEGLNDSARSGRPSKSAMGSVKKNKENLLNS